MFRILLGAIAFLFAARQTTVIVTRRQPNYASLKFANLSVGPKEHYLL